MAYNEIKLAYGRGNFAVPGDIAGDAVLLDPDLPLPLSDPEAELRKVLREARFADLVAGKKRVVILAADITRPAAQPLVTGELVREILRETPDARIEVIYAGGMHRPMSEDEMRRLAGEAAARVTLSDNRAGRADEYMSLGATAGGLPVKLLRRAAEADAVILTGAVAVHYLAGFGGGRKIVLPGIAAHDCIVDFHSHSLVREPECGRHPAARSGVLEGNPLHEAATEAMRLLDPLFAVNVLMSEGERPARFFCGDPEKSFAEAAAEAARSLIVDVETPYDVAIASAGGYPRDINLVQSHKAIDFAAGAVRDGGMLIVAAECVDGAGNPELLKHCRIGSAADICRKLAREFVINGQTAMALKEKTERLKVILISGLPAADVSCTGAIPARDLKAALTLARDEIARAREIAIIPHAGKFCFRQKQQLLY